MSEELVVILSTTEHSKAQLLKALLESSGIVAEVVDSTATHWGVERYGGWAMLMTMPALLAMGDLGFASASTVRMAQDGGLCPHCGQEYSPNLRRGGNLPRGWTICPWCGNRADWPRAEQD